MGQSQDANPDDERWAAAIGRAMNARAPAAGGDLSVGAEALTEDATAHQPMGGTSDAGGMIGGYRLLELIGEGGFGSVFLAEQVAPVRRRVALKVIKPGMDTRQVIARFDAERQALALMDHPNIARVFDAGATVTGRPYFVMEWVRGVPITRYCDEHRLATDERLGLFVRVCGAVQHAHQKAIIHRDLKPSNVLVTHGQDGAAVPKVIDFGIAKATGQQLTGATFTGTDQFVGTPQYMSPEQAGLAGVDVDTRSDIYSLGVLLYELLTGTTPFDPAGLKARPLDEIQRMVREVEPDRPSTRLNTLPRDALGQVATRQRTEPARLGRVVRGELDWVVMKCLSKDPSRRYESAGALAADVQRFLEGLPVAARPPSLTYRLAKAARRHRAAVVAAGAVVAAVLLGIAGLAAGVVRARAAQARAEADAARSVRSEARAVEQKRAAEQSASAAARQAAKAQAVNQFLQDMLRFADPEQATGEQVNVRDILDQASARLVAGAFKDEPELEADVRAALGRGCASLGDVAAAESHLRTAVRLYASAAGPDCPQLAQVYLDLGGALERKGDMPGAGKALHAGLALAERLWGKDNLARAKALDALGAYELLRSGDPVEAERMIRESLAITRKHRGERHPDVGLVLVDLAWALDKKRDRDGSEQLALEAKSIFLQSEHDQWRVAGVNNLLSSVLHQRGDDAGSAALLRDAVEQYRKRFGGEHFRVAVLLQNLAMALRSQGDRAGAAAASRQAIEIALALQQKAIRDNPNDASWRVGRAVSLARIGRLKDALEDATAASQLDPGNHRAWYLGACLRLYLGDVQGFRRDCRSMLARCRESADATACARTARACLLVPDPVESPESLRRLVEGALPGAGRQLLPELQLSLALAEYRGGRTEAALPWASKCRDAFAAALKDSPEEPAPEAECLSTADLLLAMCHQRMGRTDDARAALARARQAIAAHVPVAGEDDPGDTPEDWLICHIALREAESLLRPDAAGGG
jgi:serine/threonine protein kinase/tetratricopeptide (TPR) repeat protein